MILGTAANNSTINEIGSLILVGAISERNIAIPILRGTAMHNAINDVTRVPAMYGNAPKASLPSTGFHRSPVTNSNPSFSQINQESDINCPKINTIISKTNAPAQVAVILKILSQ